MTAKFDRNPDPDQHWLSSLDPDPHQSKKRKLNRHRNQCGFTTLIKISHTDLKEQNKFKGTWVLSSEMDPAKTRPIL